MKMKLMFGVFYLLLGCSAVSHKDNVKGADKIKVDQGRNLNMKNFLNELKGHWHPIFHTISGVYAQDTNKIQEYRDIFIGSDTAIIFNDTVFSLKYTVTKLNKTNWLFNNLDARERQSYHMLSPILWEVTMYCKIKYGKSIISDVRRFAYDGTYLCYGMDGFNFLLVKSSPRK